MMLRRVIQFVAGLLFGIGLVVSGMTNPAKVIGFLDVFHGWDPSLGLVMGGAILVHFPLYRLITRRKKPLFGPRFGIPTRTDIDPRLVGGAALFGVGWGLGGYCPGPGLTSAATGDAHALTFVAALTGGMLAYHALYAAWEGQQRVTADRAP